MEPGMDAARDVLSRVFGFSDFRSGQSESVQAAMAGRDTAVLLPTGAGKSLCFQIPGIARAQLGLGPTLVVSPLIALMLDQVRTLGRQGVRAAALNSHQNDSEARETIRAYESGAIDLLYVSPERAAQPGFRRSLARRPVGFMAIDEAHCVSQWGHDFRPEYRQLGELRETSDAPMMAVTATATRRVLREIIRYLELRQPAVVRGDFRRPNLVFSVEHISGHEPRVQRLIALLEAEGLRSGTSTGAKGIVYCATRKHSEKVAAALSSAGFSARHYHAGQNARDRERAQHAFGAGRIRVLVATNAFGMGIDFPDVRIVAHYQTPGSLEGYYQEAGRAGRDKLPARCVLFFSPADLVTQRRIASGKGVGDALAAIEHYARTDRCREQEICEHFGVEDTTPCGRCDVCTQSVAPLPSPKTVKEVTELTDAQVSLLIDAVGELSKPAGMTGIARALRGSRAKSLNKCGLLKISQHGRLRGVDERAIVHAIETCLLDGRLVRKGHKYPTVWLPNKPVRTRQASDEQSDSIPRRRNRRAPNRRRARYSSLQGALEKFRRTKARELNWKPYMVFQKRAIVAIDEKRPTSLNALLAIPGLGPAKVERFGEELLRIIRANP